MLKLHTDFVPMPETLYGPDWRIPDPSFKVSGEDENIVGKVGDSKNL